MMLLPDKTRPSVLVAYISVMTALSAVFGYIEQLIPINVFGIPGVKLGLSNIVSLIALYLFGTGYAFFIMLVRVLLLGFMFGNMYAVLFSLTGGILSVAVMAMLKRTGLFTMTGLSSAGGAAHNMGQLIVAMMTLSELDLSFYIPVLIIAGLSCGLLIGILGRMIMDKICAGNTVMEDVNDRIS